MASYRLNTGASFSIESEFAAQGLVEAMTGIVLPRHDAKVVLERIADHKWLLSEKLGRDVGMKVAAIDLVENFYAPTQEPGLSAFASKIWNGLKGAFVRYAEVRGNSMPV